MKNAIITVFCLCLFVSYSLANLVDYWEVEEMPTDSKIFPLLYESENFIYRQSANKIYKASKSYNPFDWKVINTEQILDGMESYISDVTDDYIAITANNIEQLEKGNKYQGVFLICDESGEKLRIDLDSNNYLSISQIVDYDNFALLYRSQGNPHNPDVELNQYIIYTEDAGENFNTVQIPSDWRIRNFLMPEKGRFFVQYARDTIIGSNPVPERYRFISYSNDFGKTWQRLDFAAVTDLNYQTGITITDSGFGYYREVNRKFSMSFGSQSLYITKDFGKTWDMEFENFSLKTRDMFAMNDEDSYFFYNATDGIQTLGKELFTLTEIINTSMINKELPLVEMRDLRIDSEVDENGFKYFYVLQNGTKIITSDFNKYFVNRGEKQLDSPFITYEKDSSAFIKFNFNEIENAEQYLIRVCLYGEDSADELIGYSAKNVIYEDMINDTTITFTNLETSVSYIFDVKAVDKDGEFIPSNWNRSVVYIPKETNWDDVLKFTSPDSTEKQDTEVIFSWNKYPGGTFYEWELSEREDFEEIIKNRSQYETSVEVKDLEPGKRYHFRVLANFVQGKSGWSTISFETDGINSVMDLEDSNISLYPNPANDLLTITNLEPHSEITILNLIGQEIKSIRNNSNQIKFDISHLPLGTYIVKIHNQENLIIGKFAISR